MQHRQSTGPRTVFSASNVLAALGEALAQIKHEDRLTYGDLGAVLGKSEDQAAKYCDGTATMDAITLARGRREWGSRFTGPYDRLCIGIIAETQADFACMTRMAKVMHAVAAALESDGVLDAAFAVEHRSELENAGDAIAAILRKAGPKVVA